MSNEKEFHNIFKSHKADIPDNGFSEHVMKQLPRRSSILPRIIIIACMAMGLSLVIALQGFDLILEQIDSMIVSLSRMEMPSPLAITVYLTGLLLLGSIGFALNQADSE